MPNLKKPSAQADNSANALPWKNSLLAKEENEGIKNAVEYFHEVVRNNDTFAMLFDEVTYDREEGKFFTYQDVDPNKKVSLTAFLIVQDRHGVHWICPVSFDTKKKVIEQDVCPLNATGDNPSTAYRQDLRFGSMKIDKEEYVHSCSRGFENASRVFLGDNRVRLLPEYNLIAAFYIFPKEEKK